MKAGRCFITLLLLVVLSTESLSVRAQSEARFEPPLTQAERTVDPSPQASEMMRADQVQMTLSDGTASLSIPLFDWQSGEIQMSLVYE